MLRIRTNFELNGLVLTLGIVLLSFAVNTIGYGQIALPRYQQLVQKADSLYLLNQFTTAAHTYSAAFQSNNWKGFEKDRFNASCAWARAGNADSAFHNLFLIATKLNFANSDKLKGEKNLYALLEDPRWDDLVTLVKANHAKNPQVNYPLMMALDSIRERDQCHRQKLEAITKQYGASSNQLDSLWKCIGKGDSLNLVQLTRIIQNHGWVGTDIVSEPSAYTLFLVMLHNNLATQEKYLPLAFEAVKNGKASPKGLAFLIDRIHVGKGIPQIYGTQIKVLNGQKVPYPVLDQVRINERRAEMNLGTWEEYLEEAIPEKDKKD